MPFKESSVMEKRADLVLEMMAGKHSVTELCAKYGVSRPTAYLWRDRFVQEGRAGMRERRRRPLHSPNRTPRAIEDKVRQLREQHDTWGDLKIHHQLLKDGVEGLPSCRTVGRILHRYKLTKPPEPDHETVGAFERDEPNELWQMDFKGGVPMRQRPQPQRAIPLTIEDDCSRFNIALRIIPNHRLGSVWAVLWEAMGIYGLPECILTDNEGVFRAPGSGVSAFTARLWRLGIAHISGRPYHPQTQGKVERLHGTIQRDALKGRRFDTIEELQALLHDFRDVYNHVRPHQAIEMKTPAEVYRPSARKRPPQIPPVQYPVGAQLRRVTKRGFICVRTCRINVGEGLVGESVRLHEQEDTLQVEYAGHTVRTLPWDQLRAETWV